MPGLPPALLVRDNFEAGLVAKGLPPYIETSVLGGKTVQELPLVFQDKIFVGPDTKADDPHWYTRLNLQAATQNARQPLVCPHVRSEHERHPAAGTCGLAAFQPAPDPSVIPEFFGDTMLVNGTVFPETTVQARRYRLRMLNACNARFLNLQLYIDDGSPDGITLECERLTRPNAPFMNAATGDSSWLQIGTEGGFLSHRLRSRAAVPFLITDQISLTAVCQLDPSQVNQVLACGAGGAARPDRRFQQRSSAGTKVILYNDAPAPFPAATTATTISRLDTISGPAYGSRQPVNGPPQPGFGPNTRVLMRFKVDRRQQAADSRSPSTRLLI